MYNHVPFVQVSLLLASIDVKSLICS